VKRFVATREHEGITYGEFVDADDFSTAQRICRDRGWTLEGECGGVQRDGQTLTIDQIGALMERRESVVH
jgi:hypothetical protein